MQLRTGEITQFKGTLPPAGISRRLAALPPNRNTPGGLILRALHPLHAELDTLLARNDRPTALRLAYNALIQIADALAAYRGDKLEPGQVLVHALLVELEALPLEPQPDGTLAERGTMVSVNYRNWAIAHNEANAYAQALVERFHALWPGAWVLVSPAAQPSDDLEAGGVG